MANASVLIVDGDPGFTATAQRALEAQGVQVYVYDDATIALVRKLRPHAMMVNVELPRSGASGFSICSRVRSDKLLFDTPILLTGSDVTEDTFARHAQTKHRANDYARKPIDEAEVVLRIHKLIAEGPEREAVDGSEAAGDGEAATGDLPIQSSEDAGPGAPPPLPPLAAEPWKPASFDQMVRERVSMKEPVPQRSATQDERIAMLRQRVKWIDAQLLAAKDAWEVVQAQGRQMARQNAAFKTELERGNAEASKLRKALRIEQTEYRTFNKEVERIFREKELEETATADKLSQLEEQTAVHRRDLEVSREQIEHDAQRLRIFQEEIETFQAESEQLHAALAAANADLEASAENLSFANNRISELELRLDTTETVATERAEEIERLNERIDDLVLRAEQEAKRVEAAHAEAIDGLESSHAALIETVDADHAASLEAAQATHAGELEVLQRALDAGAQSAQSLEDQLDEVRAEAAELAEAHATLGAELESALAALEAQKRENQDTAARYEEEITDLEDGHRSTAEKLQAEIARRKQAFTEAKAEHAEQMTQLVADHAHALEAAAAEHDDRLTELAVHNDEVVEALRLESEAKLDEIGEARTRAHTEYEDALDQLEQRHTADRDEWTAAVTAAETRHAQAMSAAAAKHEDALQALEAANERSTASLEAGYEEALSALRAEAERELDEAAAEIAALESAGRELVEASSSAEQQARVQAEEYQTRAEEYQARIAELEVAADASSSRAGDRIAELEVELETLEARSAEDLEAAQARIEALEAEVAQTQASLSSQLATKDADAKALIEATEAEIAEMQASLSEQLKSTDAEAEAQLAAAAAEHRAAIAEATNARSELAVQIDELEDELEETRGGLIERLAELDHTRSRKEALEAQVASLRSERDDLSQRLLDAEAATQAAEAAERSASSQADAAHAKSERAESFIKRAKEKIIELQRTGDETVMEAESRAAARLEALEGRCEAAVNEAAEWRMTAEAFQAEVQATASSNSQLEEALASLRDDAAEADARSLSMRSELEAATSSLEEATAQLEVAQAGAEAAEAELADARAELGTRFDQILSLEAELEAANSVAAKSTFEKRTEARRLELLRRLEMTLGATKELLVDPDASGEVAVPEMPPAIRDPAEFPLHAAASEPITPPAIPLTLLATERDALPDGAATAALPEAPEDVRTTAQGTTPNALAIGSDLVASGPTTEGELAPLRSRLDDSRADDPITAEPISEDAALFRETAVLSASEIDSFPDDPDVMQYASGEIEALDDLELAPPHDAFAPVVKPPRPATTARSATPDAPFAELMAEIEAEADAQHLSASRAASQRGSRPPQRRLRPLRSDDPEPRSPSATGIDENAQAILDALDADAAEGAGLLAASGDPFRQSSGLPAQAPDYDDDPEDDGMVTEIVRLDDLE